MFLQVIVFSGIIFYATFSHKQMRASPASSDDAIYAARRKVDVERQPKHESHLEDLDKLLSGLVPPKPHPYALDRADYELLKGKPSYEAVCLGLPASLPGEYCYHISSMWKLLTPDKVYRFLPRIVTPKEGFQYVLKEHGKSNDWLELGVFLGGPYYGPRKFSWWTTLTLPGLNLLCAAHRMGLANEDVPPNAIVLRCKTEYVKKHALPRVPSVLDAFFSRIFHATFDHDSPTCGLTIDLEDLEHLRSGVDEYVLPVIEIDAARVEFWPVDLNSTPATHNVSRADVKSKIHKYYKSLGAS